MKFMLVLLGLFFAQNSFADVHYEFLVRNGELLVIFDIPGDNNISNQPVRIQVRDTTTHQLVERENTYMEIVNWLPGSKFKTVMNPMNGYLDRCPGQPAGLYCGTLNFPVPGEWNLVVSYKEFHGHEEGQTYQLRLR